MPSFSSLPEDVEACKSASLARSFPQARAWQAAAPTSAKHSYQPHCRLQLSTSTSSPSPALSVTATRTHDLLIPPDCPTDAQLLATLEAIRPRAPNGPSLRVSSHGRLHWLKGRTPQRFLSHLHLRATTFSRACDCNFTVTVTFTDIHRRESRVRARVSARSHTD